MALDLACYHSLSSDLTPVMIILIIYVFFSFLQSMALTDGTPAYTAWQVADYPTYMSVYLFSVANWKDVEKTGAKPHLKQMGPYVFR